MLNTIVYTKRYKCESNFHFVYVELPSNSKESPKV